MPHNSKSEFMYDLSNGKPRVDRDVRAVLTQLSAVSANHKTIWADKSQIRNYLRQNIGIFDLEETLKTLAQAKEAGYVEIADVKIRGIIYRLTKNGREIVTPSSNSTYTENPKQIRNINTFHSRR